MEKKAWPFMAGIMDSEGSISIGQQTKKGRIYYSVRIQVANTDRRLIDWIISNFGGAKILEIKKNSFSPGSKVYRWYLYGRENQEAFLLGILPHLVIKKELSRIGINFLRSDANSKEREVFYEEAKKANSLDVPVPKSFTLIPKNHIAQYVAGFVDGDGAITGTYHRGMNICICTTDFILIKFLLAAYGGKFYARNRSLATKTIYQWFVSGNRNKERLLLDIIPYLLLKKDRAIALLEILRLRRSDLFGQNKEISDKISTLNNSIRLLNNPT